MNRRIRQGMSPPLVVLCCLLLAQSASGGTVTVVTHGMDLWGGGGPFWNMGEALFNYWDTQPGGAVEYRYDKSTLGLTALQGDIVNATNKVIVFDWAQESDRWQGGYDEAAGDALFAMLAAHDLLDSDYLHLIGHSRGTIVSSEAAQRILHYGYHVNQLTLLDTEPGPSPFSDAGPAHAWDGIGFVDNYYGFGPLLAGEPISGAYDVYLDTDHSGVHEWYTATINNPNNPNATDGFFLRTNDQSNAIPTGSPTPLIPPPDVVNGDFDYGVVELGGVHAQFANVIAGWDYHGGDGNGHVDYDGSPDYRLELDWGDDDDWKRHNWLFAPPNAVSLAFDAIVDNRSGNDRFNVILESHEGLPPQTYYPLSLGSTGGWETYAVDISDYSGSVFRFWLNIDAPGWLNVIDSQVRIDNVRFEYIPEPCTVALLSMGTLALSVFWCGRRKTR
jgi:hypothetical protein